MLLQEEEEEEDEEMDGGTDYANNYFDNGEDFDEDDNDNLDEGGIYWGARAAFIKACAAFIDAMLARVIIPCH